MDPRQQLGGPIGPPLGLEAMAEVSSSQACVSRPCIGAHGGPGWIDDTLDETTELFLVYVIDAGEPKRFGGASTILDGRKHDGLLPTLTASTKPLLAGTEVRLVDFDVPGEKASGSFGQGRTHLVQKRPDRLVVPDSGVALELKRRDPLLVTSKEEEGEKPDPQPQARAMKHHSRCDRSLPSASPALLETRARQPRTLAVLTSWTLELLRPAHRPQIRPARLLIREHLLKLDQRLWT
jgi:hypothetical protein